MSGKPTQLKLYETRSREIRPLIISDGETYRFYCCGPTVYGPAHIGNFRTFVIQDVLRRTLEATGTATKHVRNITDVDDKTIRDSQATGTPLKEFTDGWLNKFRADCDSLNLLPPHVEPGAVDHIPHQIAMIEDLIAKDHAYQGGDGSVYFRVSSYAAYGSLSHLDEREITSTTAAVADDEYDRDSVSDFALWKAWKPEDGENFWPSPWGNGRPGWHLECSAMAHEYLGTDFDLHSGGIDLIFPHHENEIAQSCCSSGHGFAQHWFHIAHLMVDGGKMSKSIGNLYTLSDLEARGHTAAELRYVLISGKYRQPLNFTLASLGDAKTALGRLAKFEAALKEKAHNSAPTDSASHSSSFDPALESLRNDLNTPGALGAIFTAVKKVKPDAISPEEAASELAGLHRSLAAMGIVLPEIDQTPTSDIPPEVTALAQQRLAAKAAKDWAAADALRAAITTAGYKILDTPDGFTLEPLP